MKKLFCDICGEELKRHNRFDVSNVEAQGKLVNGERTNLKIFISCDPGDFCKYCIIKTINKLDDRPRDAAERIE